MKIFAYQCAFGLTVEENVKRILQMMEVSSYQGGKMLCFPEMFLTGYFPKNLSHPDLNHHIQEALTKIQKKCKQLEMAVVLGHPYRDSCGLKNRASVLLPGQEPRYYEKINLADQEKAYFVPGDRVLTFYLEELKVGVMICKDQNDPFLAQRLKDQGVRLIVLLCAHFYEPKVARWKKDKNQSLPITRAIETGATVMAINTVGAHLGMVSLGGSMAVDPDGCIICAAGETEESLLSVSFWELAGKSAA